MAHSMARRLVAVVALALLAAPLFAGFAAEGESRLCTTHACPHHAATLPAAKACHHATTAATCELKCGCQGREAARLAATPPYLTTLAEGLAVVVESKAAVAPPAAATRLGHLRLEPRPPRQGTFTS
jgi:hypothetical protein